MLLFPAAFGIMLNLLKQRCITTDTFLKASAFPYYSLWLYGKNKIIGLHRDYPSEDENSCINVILETEEELFKPDETLLRWPVCQLYRNFLVVILNTFILNPIYRITLYVPIFFLFAYHDLLRLPYKHNYLNFMQCLSSGCLLVITACNFPASMTVMTNALSVPLMKTVVMVLQYVEMATCAAVPLSLVGWKLSEQYAIRKMKKDI